jgi:16S rRNA U516 pseudouridylate synthase RsuA-like enzyme
MKIKLLDYLKKHGYANSNKNAKRLIRDHTITVNGVQVKSCAIMVSSEKSPSVQIIVTDGNQECELLTNHDEHVESSSPDSFCIVYNKPCGMICTRSATEGGGYCLNHIDPPIPDDFQPVGRLDQHSHGLLLFSMDGRLTSALLSPRTAIERTYRIIVKGDVGKKSVDNSNSSIGHCGLYEEICHLVENGIQTDYGYFKGQIIVMERNVNDNYEHSKCGFSCGGERNDTYDGNEGGGRAKNDKLDNDDSCILSAITVAVKEGKKRMVRRLFAAIGLFVVGKNLCIISLLPTEVTSGIHELTIVLIIPIVC